MYVFDLIKGWTEYNRNVILQLFFVEDELIVKLIVPCNLRLVIWNSYQR